jgi:ATP phosphoribosyltransferase
LQRDKDIPRLVDCLGPGSFGLMGSDAWIGLEPAVGQRLARQSLFVLDGVRFALAVRRDGVASVNAKRRSGEPLRVAAVYADLARTALGKDTTVISLTAGGLEALPQLFPDIDGTFDLVESGRTAAENGLVIVEDNLVPVTLDAVWAANGHESVTI